MGFRSSIWGDLEDYLGVLNLPTPLVAMGRMLANEKFDKRPTNHEQRAITPIVNPTYSTRGTG